MHLEKHVQDHTRLATEATATHQDGSALRPRSYVQAYDGPESFGSTCIFILQLVTWEGTRVERHKDAGRHMGLHKGSDGAVAACGHEGHGCVPKWLCGLKKQDRPGLTCKAVSQRLRRL